MLFSIESYCINTLTPVLIFHGSIKAFERKRNDLCYMNGLWGGGVNIKSGVGFLSALNVIRDHQLAE